MAQVLIVDDEAPIRRSLRRMLERAGHEVLESATGVDALCLLARITPDVLITDLHMPGCDGFELTRALRQSGRLQPKIIVLSGDDAQVVLQDAAKMGVAALSKPFTYDELLATVEGVMARSPAVRILIVDDEPDICLAFREMLELDHFQVAVAGNGRQALVQLAMEPVDVVLTDLYMPELDGLGLLRELRHGAGPRPAVIAMTGSSMLDRQTALQQAQLLGAGMVLEKPISRQQLVATILALVRSTGPSQAPVGEPPPEG